MPIVIDILMGTTNHEADYLFVKFYYIATTEVTRKKTLVLYLTEILLYKMLSQTNRKNLM